MNNGEIHVAIYNPNPIYIVPPITVLIIFPLKTAAIKQTINGIVAKSPKGNTLFPGNITASKIVIGTSIKDDDKTAGWPTDKAESIPR